MKYNSTAVLAKVVMDKTTTEAQADPATWCNSLCAGTHTCVAWTVQTGSLTQCDMFSAAGAISKATNHSSGLLPTSGKFAPIWSYCTPEVASKSRRLLKEGSEDPWVEDESQELLAATELTGTHAGEHVMPDGTLMKNDEMAAWLQEAGNSEEVAMWEEKEGEETNWLQDEPKNAGTVDCVDGTSSTSRYSLT